MLNVEWIFGQDIQLWLHIAAQSIIDTGSGFFKLNVLFLLWKWFRYYKSIFRVVKKSIFIRYCHPSGVLTYDTCYCLPLGELCFDNLAKRVHRR